MFVGLYVHNLFDVKWSSPGFGGNLDITPRKYHGWKKDDTYFIIFSPTQHKQLKLFKENCGGFNILYEGKPAYNVGHGDMPRNTMFIFEVKEEFFGENKE